MKKRKKSTELEIEAKKSKVEAMPSFGATSEDDLQHHSVEIVMNELVEAKSENEADMDKDSEPEPSELGREKEQRLFSSLFVTLTLAFPEIFFCPRCNQYTRPLVSAKPKENVI